MKTRIVYPRLWKDDKFALSSIESKLLFSYLISCDSLGLSRYHRITDRQIIFDTGLDSNQLVTSKKELTDIKWCFFHPEWVYHNHDAAYISYEGRDRVMDSKAKEINDVPKEVKDYFNPLITRSEPVLNTKPETITTKSLNQEPETINKDFGEFSPIGRIINRKR